MPKKPKKPAMLKKPKAGASKETLANWMKRQQEREKNYKKALQAYEAGKKLQEKVRQYRPKL